MASNKKGNVGIALKLEVSFGARNVRLALLLGVKELLICWSGVLALALGRIPEGLQQLLSVLHR